MYLYDFCFQIFLISAFLKVNWWGYHKTHESGQTEIWTGHGCSKLTMSLVNEMLEFQKLLSFFQQKISVYLGKKL